MNRQNSRPKLRDMPFEDALVEHGCQRGAGTALAQVSGDRGRRKGDGYNEKRQQEIAEQQSSVDLGEVLEQCVMVSPDNPNGDETDEIRRERRPGISELPGQRSMA